MNRKILFECRSVKGVRNAWEYWGYEVFESQEELSLLSEERILHIVSEYKELHGVAYVFSFDFFPSIAKACHDADMQYVCWVLDCPHISLWSKTAEYGGNHIFVFDYIQYEMLQKRGLKNISYLPLCGDYESFAECIQRDKGKSIERFSHDVSFVGNLYRDEKHSLYDRIGMLPQYLSGYLDGLMQVQRKMWGVDLLYGGLSDDVLKGLKQCVRFELGERYADGAYEVMFGNMIGQKIAQMERLEMSQYLSEHFDFALFSGDDTAEVPSIKNYGSVSYLHEMPLVFHYSKINIHITLRSIPSGMSLRVLDVLACGGFLLTNYQPEIAEYFVDGEELVMYYSMEDLYDKITYYLGHEDERKKIALAGQKKVIAEFNYIKGIGEIVKTVEGENAKRNSGV